MNQYLEEAKRQLAILQCGTNQYEECLYRLREALRKGGCSLSDLGQTEGSIGQLRVYCCQISARQLFDSLVLSQSPERYDQVYKEMMNHLEVGCLPLAAIPVVTDEFKAIRLSTAHKMIKKLKEGGAKQYLVDQEARRYLKWAGLESNEIEGEIQKILPQTSQPPCL